MRRFMVAMFGLLVAAWYLLSGGSEFEPGDVGVTVFAPPLSEAERAERQAARAIADPQAPLQRATPVPAPAEPVREAEPTVAVPDPSDPALRQVATDRAPMHGGPDRSFGILLELLIGEAVRVEREQGGWAQVEVVDGGALGWVRQTDLAPYVAPIAPQVRP